LPVAEERTILVGLETRGRPGRNVGAGDALEEPTGEESVRELGVLAESAGAQVVQTLLQTREAPDPATLIGSGKVAELSELVQTSSADLVIFDREVSPTQLRNLERSVHCRIVDRTQLILDIFASRARTREGQLQVELAQLNYLLPRLTGRGAEMSRLGGGIGTRGPGETQLETDRRRIFRRIRKIEQDLESVRAGRSVQRGQRRSVPLATIGLAGYTNAGKSTLFNRLTGAAVTADARMFATLDPTVRQLTLPSNRRVLLSDTVGFIRNLPTTLVRAFRATLEEVVEASLILHVIDVSAPDADRHTQHVMHVLAEIGATKSPQLLVLNKADLLAEADHSAETVRARVLGNVPEIERAAGAVVVSARTAEGVDALLQRIDQMLPLDPIARARYRIPHDQGAALHLLHEYARVLQKRFEQDYADVVADAPESVRRRLTEFAVESDEVLPETEGT
jgi:GTP-binding protein HflX